MEKEVKTRKTTGNNNTKNVKKVIKKAETMNVEMENKTLVEKTKELYHKKMKITHIIVCILVVVLYTFAFSSNVGGEVMVSDSAVTNGFFEQVGYLALLDAVIIIAGFTPYCFLSIIGMLEAITITNDMMIRKAYELSTLPTMYVGGLIQMIGLSLIVAAGLYYCVLATKKNRYYTHSNFGIKDLKMQFYTLKNDSKKLKELENKEIEKQKKVEALNVKIPYMSFALIWAITLAIQVIGLIITKI